MGLPQFQAATGSMGVKAAVAFLIAAFMIRAVIYCVGSWAAANLLCKARVLHGILTFNLTSDLESDPCLFQNESIFTPNYSLSFNLNRGQGEVSKDMDMKHTK